MEVMDMRGAWVSLRCRSSWALRNWQLRGMSRQRSCEEVLMQKGLRVANKRQLKKSCHYQPPEPFSWVSKSCLCACLEHCPSGWEHGSELESLANRGRGWGHKPEKGAECTGISPTTIV